MANSSYKELIKQIEKHEVIIIAKHRSPDWDAQGSSVGLAEIIKANFKKKKVFIVGENLLKNQKFDDNKLTQGLIQEALLICVDTANYKRIDFFEWNRAKTIFKIDHHIEPIEEHYGDKKIIYPEKIACAQIITEFAIEKNLKVTKKAAQNLFKGIVTDSNRFLYKNVDHMTMVCAAYLIKCNIDIHEIYDSLYLKDLNTIKSRNEIFDKIVFNVENRYAYLIIDDEYIEKYGLENAKGCLSLMANIQEIDIWFIVYKNELGEIKISFRSKANKNVSEIAKKFKGGGHKNAAAGVLKSLDDINKVLKILNNK